MKFLHDYIQEFKNDPQRAGLASELDATKRTFDIHLGGNARKAFETFVERYNWLGQPVNKQKYNISQNLARNLPGSLMQDFLIHLVIQLCKSYSQLDVFTEVRVPFGHYPLWDSGKVAIKSPAEHSDLAVGYLLENSQIKISTDKWPKPPIYKLESKVGS